MTTLEKRWIVNCLLNVYPEGKLAISETKSKGLLDLRFKYHKLCKLKLL